MKIMAVDYGAKRVGVASTDESGEFALPRAVLPNDDTLVDTILKQISDENIEKVVVGDSKNLDGTPNAISKDINIFVEKLKAEKIDVVMHPEVYTSMEADRLQGQNDMRDASAAALILKSYIDLQNN
ncbi:MAG: Holliday junction resolvase RuvX [Minisyncoccia bacterium]